MIENKFTFKPVFCKLFLNEIANRFISGHGASASKYTLRLGENTVFVDTGIFLSPCIRAIHSFLEKGLLLNAESLECVLMRCKVQVGIYGFANISKAGFWGVY